MSSLGCGKKVINKNNHHQVLFICGVADGWGYERLCNECEEKLKRKWRLKK